MNCTIGYHGFSGDGWWYYPPKGYQKLTTIKRKRCFSCKVLINLDSIVLKFNRARSPKNDIEERIHGDEVYIASVYFCEKCSDIYFNLEDLGYSVAIMDMREALSEYKELKNNIQAKKI